MAFMQPQLSWADKVEQELEDSASAQNVTAEQLARRHAEPTTLFDDVAATMPTSQGSGIANRQENTPITQSGVKPPPMHAFTSAGDHQECIIGSAGQSSQNSSYVHLLSRVSPQSPVAGTGEGGLSSPALEEYGIRRPETAPVLSKVPSQAPSRAQSIASVKSSSSIKDIQATMSGILANIKGKAQQHILQPGSRVSSQASLQADEGKPSQYLEDSGESSSSASTDMTETEEEREAQERFGTGPKHIRVKQTLKASDLILLEECTIV